MQLRRANCLSLLVATCILAAPTHAQDSGDNNKLTVHGYFTQAYAKTDRLPILGITKDGTWNYRVLALQARYALTDEDQLLIQARYQQMGVSPINDENVDIQWAYYQHKFSHLTVAVGKAPLPQGLYNNVREVGTILPFYRAPVNYYLPAYETIEGVVLSNSTPLGAWRLETMAYYGATEYKASFPTASGPIAIQTRSEADYGSQVWLETPIKGVRVGWQFLSFLLTLPADTLRSNLNAVALDATFDRMFVRSEYERFPLAEQGPNGEYEIETDAWAETGVKLTDKLTLSGQYATSSIHYPGNTYRSTIDRVVGVSYAFEPNVVLKVEGHHTSGYAFDVPLLPTDPAGKTNYGILSISTSF